MPDIPARQAVKYAVIRGVLDAIAWSGARRLLPSAGGRGVIFTLHHVRPSNGASYDPNAPLSVTPEFLDTAVQASLEAGLTPVAVEDLPELLADPADKRRFVSFTLDDGYRDNAEHAAPVFRRYGVPYTIFITAGFVERTHSLWWETVTLLTAGSDEIEFDFGGGAETLELATNAQKHAAYARFSTFVETAGEDEAVARIDALARRCGIDPLAVTSDLTMDASELRALAADPLARFGAHTLTHVNLRRVSEARLREELKGSAQAVETYVGRYPRAFAYPYGFAAAVGEREVEAAARAGFAVAVTTQPGVLSAAILDRPTAASRVSLNGYFQKKRYVEALLSGLAFKLT
ncbi:polysaccharide deacetylase family protein [Chelativorans sp. AA-79]|uniref:polysaccharide deacetylase family protein n=1 Tax=Chelativorans sp. AA-79 TaxID=3028735 RepID=UPI0023F63F60|nr:polysaccharide deacetylase family protein [Chelativorans sp. AA-79]WEX08847.1 polysaccharide deacetylase family protein [Chelativorans sp. AA-79]